MSTSTEIDRVIEGFYSIYSKHDICSAIFLLRFHGSFAGRLHNQIRTTYKVTCLWKLETDTKFISSLFLHNTTSITVIIEWNVLFVEKIFLIDFFNGSQISDHADRRHANNTENAMSASDIFILI